MCSLFVAMRLVVALVVMVLVLLLLVLPVPSCCSPLSLLPSRFCCRVSSLLLPLSPLSSRCLHPVGGGALCLYAEGARRGCRQGCVALCPGPLFARGWDNCTSIQCQAPANIGLYFGRQAAADAACNAGDVAAIALDVRTAHDDSQPGSILQPDTAVLLGRSFILRGVGRGADNT